jgi:hypothetical protein
VHESEVLRMETLQGCDGTKVGDSHIYFSNFPPAIKFKAIFQVDNGWKNYRQMKA